MRLESSTEVLAKRMLKYYRLSRQIKMQQAAGLHKGEGASVGSNLGWKRLHVPQSRSEA